MYWTEFKGVLGEHWDYAIFVNASVVRRLHGSAHTCPVDLHQYVCKIYSLPATHVRTAYLKGLF